MKLNKNIHLLIISLLLLLSACVGKIEEAAVPITNQFTDDPIYFDYKGLETATAISNDKVELSFDVASGAQTDIEYKLYVNDAKEGVTLGLDALSTHFKGRYYYMVRGLDINTQYNFKVRAFNKVTGGESKQENIKSVRTYNNKVSDFGGVINLKLVPGQEDDAVEVLWERVPFVFMFLESKQDPVKYEIVYSSVSPEELFNSKSTLRTVVSIPTDLPVDHPNSWVINNLESNKTYYFAVRAIHRGYQEYVDIGATYIPLDRETNTKFLSIKTSGIISWTSAISANFNIQNARGESGYKDVVLSWDRAQGSYSGYKIIYKKYTGQLSSINSYQFTKTDIDTITSSNNSAEQGVVICLNSPNPCPGGNTQQTLKNLTPGAWYHFKLFVCEGTDTGCPIIKEDNVSFAKSYDTKHIQVRPSLATFMGINSIASPTSSSDYSEITLEFTPPDIVTGWADTMKFFCVDTNDNLKKQYELTTTGLTNAGKCTGLKRASFIDTAINTMTQLKVSGTTIGEEYCFTASPEFNDPPFVGSEAVRISEPDRIKRCIYPEIMTPSISQFSGLSSCTTQSDVKKITGNWQLPSGGIYQDYVLFWKLKSSTNTPFSFTTAIAQYESSGTTIRTSCSDETYCFSKISGLSLSYQTPVVLDHGTYELGVMSLIKLTQGSGNLYKWSQINTNIKRCDISLPKATFQSWTRIFAIGPKENHLNPDTDKYTDEAMTFSGIPFEVGATSQLSVFFQPPGQGYTVQTDISNGMQYIDISGAFDGVRTSGHLGSNSGIISFAWEDFDLDNDIDESGSSLWKTESDNTSRQIRSYGYKVFRSKDNRLNWEDITPNNVIHARDFSYKERPNKALTTKRMAFFSDYTVKNLEANKVGNVEFDQARIYWYKVVPIFKKTTLTLTNPQMAMVKITLPPPNMALVHRWMANRSQCLELGLTPDPNNNYSCTFTGVGAVPKTIPFSPGETKIDLKGDLLIDRFELGCNYTKGSPADQVTPNYTSKSSFNSSTFNKKGCFKVATSNNTLSGDKFTLNSDNPLPSQLDTAPNTNLPPDSNSKLKEFLLYGDCIGNSSLVYPTNLCNSYVYGITAGKGNLTYFNSPGFKNSATEIGESFDSCLTDDISKIIQGFEWSKENLAQSTFGAVYQNNNTGYSYSLPVVMKRSNQYTIDSSYTRYAASCSINLAAINAGEYLPRWVDLNTMDGKLHQNINLSKSPLDLINDSQSGLYDDDKLIAPASNSSTPIGKIMTSNKAGIPPIRFLERETGKKLCSLYKVRQAFKAMDSAGTIETGVGPIMDKRYLRRREFVAASMWPEKYDEAEIEFLEGARGSYDQTYGNIVSSAFSGKSCHNERTMGFSDSLKRWSKMPEKFSTSLPFISGSTNTHQCISRYGIQDLVGNQEEASSDVVFCDYAPIELRWGKCSGGPRSVNGKCPEIRDEDPHIVLNSNYFTENRFRVLSKGAPSSPQTPSRFSIINNKTFGEERGVASLTTETDSTGEEWGYYVKSEINAGYCSFVDNDNTRRSTFQFWDQDYFSDFFFNTINSNLVPLSTRIQSNDAHAPYTVRDGSGYFLDFGENHMTTPLRDTGNLGLPWTFGGHNTGARTKETKSNIENYPLFSTLLGLPLMCESDISGGWGDACIEHNVHVMEMKTFELVDALNPAAYEFPKSVGNLTQTSISDFFIGGSTFNNSGLTDVSSSLHTQSAAVPSYYGDSIITGVTINEDGTTSINRSSSDQYSTLDDLKTFRIDWSIRREQSLYLSQGGHGNKDLSSAYNGRFSLEIKPNDRGSISDGIRCGVMINENE